MLFYFNKSIYIFIFILLPYMVINKNICLIACYIIDYLFIFLSRIIIFNKQENPNILFSNIINNYVTININNLHMPVIPITYLYAVLKLIMHCYNTYFATHFTMTHRLRQLLTHRHRR